VAPLQLPKRTRASNGAFWRWWSARVGEEERGREDSVQATGSSTVTVSGGVPSSMKRLAWSPRSCHANW